jgi:AbrB family looped-hinge helix DNA binding protein
MLASKLTAKYQATVPEKVRKLLGLKKGDLIAFDIKKSKITLKKVSPIDLQFAKSLETTFSEWNSKNDEEAYRDL